MIPHKKPLPKRAMALSLCAAFFLSGCGEAKKEAAGPPPAVVVEKAFLMDINNQEEFTGRIEAQETVDIRARVQGFLQKRDFTEGDFVKKDQLLYLIEPDSYKIAVERSQASLTEAQAALVLAKQTYERKYKLAQRDVASRAVLDEARANLSRAEAAVLAQKAILDKAKLDLSYTTIESPIHGRIGRTQYTVGNLVSPASQPLVTIVKQDPMYVTFPVRQELLLQIRKSKKTSDSVKVQLRMPDNSIYNQLGVIKFADVQAEASTDSVIVRAEIPNPDGLLVDKELVHVRVVEKEAQKKLVVSQSALLLDQLGPYVLKVTKDDKVVQQRIKTGEQHGPLIITTDGLKPDDRVIVSGHMKVRPGDKVRTSEAQAAHTMPPVTTSTSKSKSQ